MRLLEKVVDVVQKDQAKEHEQEASKHWKILFTDMSILVFIYPAISSNKLSVCRCKNKNRWTQKRRSARPYRGLLAQYARARSP